jgi:sRNA-binding carbon storage regulator CsrA
MGKLVVSRKRGESITITDPTNPEFGKIVITQQDLGSGKSSLMIDAPNHIIIKRSELVKLKAEVLTNE